MTNVEGQKGFNTYRWDLVVKSEKSNLPYFVHYDKFIEASSYTLILLDGKTVLEQVFIAKNGASSHNK